MQCVVPARAEARHRTAPASLCAAGRRPSARWLALIALALVGVACSKPDPLVEIREQHARGEYEATIEPLREVLRERREDPEVLFLYGRALNATATPTESLWALRVAMDDPRFLAPAGLAIASGAHKMRNFTVALEALERVLEAHPDDLDALLLRARVHADSRLDNEQALTDAERVLELDPESVQAMEPKIVALLAMKRIDEAGEAMAQLGEMIEQSGLDANTRAWHCATMAIFAEDSEELELATERWEECLEAFPGKPEVVQKSVAFFDGQRRWARAIEILERAVETAPRAMGFRVGLAARYRMGGDNERAEAVLREATAFDDPALRVAAWLGLVTHFQALGLYSEAAEAGGSAVEVAQEAGEAMPQLIFDYADALVMSEQFERAEELAETMTVAAHKELILGRSRLMQGDAETALAHFSEAFRLWPDNGFARYYAAIAAEEIGDFDRAIEEYRYAIRLDPGGTDARQRLARIHVAEGKPYVALHALRVKVETLPLDLEGELLSLRLFAEVGHAGPMRKSLESFHETRPALLGRAVASAAHGLSRRMGHDFAVRSIIGADGLRLTDPEHVDALRALIEHAHAVGRQQGARGVVGRALEAHPESADLHAALGFALALEAPDSAESKAAYRRALELDGDHVLARIGLGDALLTERPAEALAEQQRALERDPENVAAALGRSRARAALGDLDRAEAELSTLLREHPVDTDVARALLALQVQLGHPREVTEPLEQRIARFDPPLPQRRIASPPPASAKPDEALAEE